MTLAPRPTLFITSPRLDRHVGLDVTLASETLQHTGSFKFRAAFNNAAQRKAAHLIATSSGNFGQALAYACQLHGKRCTVIMPHDASLAKVRAVRTYGAEVDLVDTRAKPAALSLAAVLTEPGRCAGRVCCVVTGASVDPAIYAQILQQDREVAASPR